MTADATTLQHLLDALVRDVLAEAPIVPGVVVATHHPGTGVAAAAHGLADPAGGEAITAAHTARIASCTKTFVASTVLVLAGDGALGLDDAAVDHLPHHVAEQLARFEHGPQVTVRQLLQHRSGLVDHTLFPEFERSPFHRWTPEAQIEIAVGKPALFSPGDAFSYSDTGYVLLGQLVEHLSGQPLAAAVRSRLGLRADRHPSIHWELAEPTPDGTVRAHQLHHGVDTYGWDPSLDLFGGGGIVASMPDLAAWWTELFAGRVHPYLTEQTGSTAPTLGPDGAAFPGGHTVGLGMFRRDVDGVSVWSHGGYWGLQTLHVPSLGASASLVLTHRADGAPTPGSVADRVVRCLLAA